MGKNNVDKAFKMLANEVIARYSFQNNKKNDKATSQKKMITDQIKSR